ncbi:hypothetical protein V1508DRAFT_359710 [Lipomyces doorenjongii]|uniref:uncharacterized protein n=1 Tax=Lipomyces doorenjongii TaxID=383834 RepID=UPI0034CD21DC
MTSKIAFVLGAGPNIGHDVSKMFAGHGYKVAIVNRSGVGASGYLKIKADLSDPLSVASAFKQVRDSLGEPNVVIYNAFARRSVPEDDAFSLATSAFQEDLAVNVSSLYAALQETVKGWRHVANSHKVFIFTGNALNVAGAVPQILTYGVGKTAAAHLIDAAVKSYGSQGYKFYYVDERKPDGSPVKLDRDGNAHAKVYFQLAEEPEQGPWDYTFVKSKGFSQF